MNNLTELIGTADFLLLLIYATAAWFFMRFFVFKGHEKKVYTLLMVFFILKILGTVANNLLIVYYWKIADSLSYFEETKNLYHMILNNVSNVRYIFAPVTEYDNAIKLDNLLSATTSGSGLESNFFVTRVCTVLYPLALGKFLLLNFLLCFIATIAQFKMYLVLADRYPQIKKYLGICVLYLPTLLLYASPIYKETLCFSFIGFLVYNLYQVKKRHNIVSNTFSALLNTAFILLIKPYVVYTFLLALGAVLFFKAIFLFYTRSVLGRLLSIFILIVFSITFALNTEFFDPYIASFADVSNFFQQQYNGDFGESSSFQLGEMEMSTTGLLKKAPLAFYTTYFRPHLWEVRKPIMLLSAIESFAILLLTLAALIKNGIHIRAILKNDLPLTITISYVLVFGIIIGLTTFNFGTLVRYKVPGLPFLWLFTFLLLNYKPKPA
jgi:hypothetical protein